MRESKSCDPWNAIEFSGVKAAKFEEKLWKRSSFRYVRQRPTYRSYNIKLSCFASFTKRSLPISLRSLMRQVICGCHFPDWQGLARTLEGDVQLLSREARGAKWAKNNAAHSLLPCPITTVSGTAWGFHVIPIMIFNHEQSKAEL